MSLDIAFYTQNGEPSVTVELSEEFWLRLIESDFVEIGHSHKTKIELDGEEREIEAVDLNKGKITNRQRLIDFFKEEIVEESKNLMAKLGEAPSKDEYLQQSYSLKKFHEIAEILENTEYAYLQRVT
ncbi:MAG: hypothetical protein AB4290_01915 [Spirulina sp.]